MTRILLINPPSRELLGSPLIGQQYVAAALLAKGCEVRVLDAAARFRHTGTDKILATVDEFRPDVAAFGLFTRWVWHAYQAAKALRGKVTWLIAGGPHATARPREVLEQGFDVAFAGEAEQPAARFIDFIEGRCKLESIEGVHFAGGSGPPPRLLEDLDALPESLDALPLYDSRWYDPSGLAMPPGGMLSSRGCPAHCTFCANYVTGRKFRYRSAEKVVAELNRLHTLTGATFVPFWDDALTANRARLIQMCRAIEDGVRFPLAWSAITRANMVTPRVLDAMKRAGCLVVNFGVESGDDRVLRAIRKGIITAQVERALHWAKERGLMTSCNFMMGFPQETPTALENTRRFMERIAPQVDYFSTLGVVVPYPATPIYDDFHAEYRFTNWWLEECYSRYTLPPSTDDFERFRQFYIDDANLELDFFRYSGEMRSMIRECLRYKAEHNLKKYGCGDGPHAPSHPTETANTLSLPL
jgi:radical SAM superfamily enzyme YgiQ (UPF0313 family)